MRDIKTVLHIIFLSILLFQTGCSPDEPSGQASDLQRSSHRDGSLSCESNVSENNRKRLIGLAVSPSSQEYRQSLQDAFEAGSSFFEIPQQWRSYGSVENQTILRILTRILKSQDIPVVLMLNPLDTTESRIPLDLRKKRYDDPEFLRRYLRFVDAALIGLKGVKILSIGVGNEADILLGDDRDAWRQYANFFKAARAHIKRACPEVGVGVKFTFDGIMNKGALVRPIIDESDHLMMSFYPVDQRSVRPVDGMEKNIETLLAAYPDKTVHLNEIGYPYSSRLGSSHERQSAFVERAFEIFDRHPRIELMNFVWLNDMPPTAGRQLRAAMGDTGTVHFLTTLGLRDHQGRSSAAFEAFRSEARARGFGSLSD